MGTIKYRNIHRKIHGIDVLEMCYFEEKIDKCNVNIVQFWGKGFTVPQLENCPLAYLLFGRNRYSKPFSI